MLGAKLPIRQSRFSRGLGTVGLNTSRVSAELTPAQLTASRIVKTVEGVTEEAFFGGGKLAKTKNIAQRAAAPRFVANKIDEITGGLEILSLDEIGALTQDAIHGSRIAGQRTRGASGAWNSVKRIMFKNVTNQVTEPIDISSAQRIAQSVLDEAQTGGRRLKLPEKTKTILEAVAETGNLKSMEDLIFARSDVGDLVRTAQLADEPKAEQVLAPVMKELTDLMRGAARRTSAGTLAELDAALKFTAKGKDRFSSNLIRKLIAEKTPSQKVVRAIFGAPGDETLVPLDAVRNVKNILIDTVGKNPREIANDKYAWDQLRFGWLSSRIKNAADIDGVLTGKRFAEILDTFGDDALGEMFSPAELKGIQEISLQSRLFDQKSRKIASLIVKSAQVAAVGGGAATGKESISFLALGGPVVLGQFLTSSAGRKWLAAGVKTSTLEGATGQFIAGMLRTKKDQQVKQKRLEKFEADKRRVLETQKLRLRQIEGLRGSGGLGGAPPARR